MRRSRTSSPSSITFSSSNTHCCANRERLRRWKSPDRGSVFLAGLRGLLADDLRKPQRPRACSVAVGEDEIELAVALAAFAQRQRLECPRRELVADFLFRKPRVAVPFQRRLDRRRHVTHG